MKIYFSQYFDDYIFVIGGQPYVFFFSSMYDLYPASMSLEAIWPQHLLDKHAVEFVCEVLDD